MIIKKAMKRGDNGVTEINTAPLVGSRTVEVPFDQVVVRVYLYVPTCLGIAINSSSLVREEVIVMSYKAHFWWCVFAGLFISSFYCYFMLCATGIL